MTARKDEDCFPRGRSSTTKPALRKVKDRLFKKYKKPKKKTFKSSFLEDNKNKGKSRKSASAESLTHVIRPLTYQNLEEGMVVVGRVREILPFHMFICLPGKLSAKVSISGISKPYSQSLARLQRLEITQKDCPPLSDLFTEGQAIVCSIVEVKKDGGVLAVNASLDPALVNKDRSHHVVRAGHILVAAVHTVEDHGYTLYTGIAGLTAFLKFGNAAKYVELKNHGRALVVGELVRCLVTKCTTARSTSRAEVTLDPKTMAETVISDGNAQTLHPGTSVRCTVQQSSKAGLVVTVGSSKAYVEVAQLPNCWSSPKYIQAEEELTATVIYSLPNTDFQITSRPTYLTLKDIRHPTTPKLGIGDVLEAKVTKSGHKGLTLCLGDRKDKELGNKGFVSIRRLGEIIPKENIARRFPLGTIVTTKIIAFDYMEEIYNCTLEKDKLEQHYVSVAQAQVGDRVSCRVTEVEPAGLRLSLGPVRLYAFKEHSADDPYDNLHQHFSIGDIVDARVLRINPTNRQVYVTLKETLIRSPALTTYEMANKGDCYWGTVQRVNENNSLYVTFYNNVAGIVQVGATPSGSFKEGQLAKCYVTSVNAPNGKLYLSLTTPEGRREEKRLVIGGFYQLVISSVNDDYLVVSPCDYDGIEGLIPKCHLHDPKIFMEGDFLRAWFYLKKGKTHYFSPNPAIEYFFKNSANIKYRYRMTCCVEGIKNKTITVLTSLREIPTVAVPKKEWTDDEMPCIHQLVRLYVKEFDLGRKTLKLMYNKPPKHAEEITNQGGGTAVTNEAVDESLINSEMNSKKKGKNKKITKEFEEINQTNELSESDTQNPIIATKQKAPKIKKESEKIHQDTFSKKKVKKDNSDEPLNKNKKTKIPKIKEEGELNTDNFVSDHLTNAVENKTGNDNKECHVDGKRDDNKNENVTSFGNENETKETQKVDRESDLNTSDFDTDDCKEVHKNKKRKKKRKAKQNLKKKPSSESDSDQEEDLENEKKKLKSHPKKSTLSDTGFLWDIKPEDLSKPSEDALDDIDEDGEDSNKEKKRKSAAERRQAAKEEEARLRQVEQTLLETENNPQSVDQFDRAVLARPDDDELWIKYMAHHLQATEIEKARAVARRALQTINQRLEVERLNVWIALLNLENLFGTQESLKSTLEEACRTNDEFTVCSKMLTVYSQSKKAQEAEQLVHTMLRKFRESLECWTECCSALMSCGLAEKARNLLQRAISVLPTKQHVNLLCKFALLENQHGNSEQAQTLFEHILTTYPKRTDIWNVYVDMLVKSGKVSVARQILDRVTKQKLPPRKMKMLFNKWISFEEKNGNPEKVEYVKKQALAYVNNITNKLEVQ